MTGAKSLWQKVSLCKRSAAVSNEHDYGLVFKVYILLLARRPARESAPVTLAEGLAVLPSVTG